MKLIPVLCLLLLAQCYEAKCQSLIIKGKIKCQNQSLNSTKGAENVIVVPAFMPSRATLTSTQPSGYFEFNTGVPISKLQDKQVTIYLVSGCTNCQEAAKRVYISEDQDRQNRNDLKKYVTIKDWTLNTKCQAVELKPYSADSILGIIVKQPDQNLEKISATSSLVGTPALLNLLTTITPVLGVFTNAGSFQAVSLEPGKIRYGEFLFSSPLILSANTGFNFSPSRDISEAAFWNPSAIAHSRKPHNVSLLTNFKNNVKLGGYYRINENFTLAAAGIYSFQDERRKSTFVRVPEFDPYDILEVDSTKMKLNEFAAFISPVYKVSDRLSAGVTLKSIWQNFNTPDSLFLEFGENDIVTATFTDSMIKEQHFDLDISATFKVFSALQIGVNLMNVAGTQLYADAFIKGQSDIPMKMQRSLGFGLVYKWHRLNAGTDLLFNSDGLYDATVGINIVPFNNALLSAGIALKQLSYSFAFRMKYFRLAYINDNRWMVNERRNGKTDFLNGKLFGGFIFDLD
jgi:hypothetical protein